MDKTEIRVTIDDEPKQQRAIEILNKHGEDIWDDERAMKFGKYADSLIYCIVGEDWYIGSKSGQTEITLEQLDELLTQEKQK